MPGPGSTVSDGRYLVRAKLGEGGMGIVYHAQDTRLGMDVVIKVPRQAMLDDPEFAGRFAHEIRSLVRLSHPCIVKVTDVGKYDGLPFAIMQYLPGGSLEDRQLAAGGQPAGCSIRGRSRAGSRGSPPRSITSTLKVMYTATSSRGISSSIARGTPSSATSA